MRQKTISCLFLISLVWISSLSMASEPDEKIDSLILQIQEAFNSKNIDEYLGFFHANIRETEKTRIISKIEDFFMEKISIHKVLLRSIDENAVNLHLRVKYENEFSVLIEQWQMKLVKIDGVWRVNQKDETGDIQTLYKISIPSVRMERVESVEINHIDIQLVFREAAVFYDNLPNRETALLIIGKGPLRFSPSLESEQHQLELIYGTPVLADDLRYAYIRCSNSFFKNNILITPADDGALPISDSEQNKAYSLFMKHYSRSFTIESSLNSELLSFLPQGDEVVIEFEGQKIGIYTYIYSPFAEEEISFFQWEEQRIVNLYSPQTDDKKQQFFISIGQKFDITHYDVEINYRPLDYYFSGKVKVEVESEMGTFNMLKFKFNPGLQILRINDEEKQLLFFTLDKLRQTLYVYLPPSLGTRNSASVEVYYRGNIEPNAPLTEMLRGSPDKETPMLIPSKYETYMYTQSSYWYPSAANDDYFTANVKITVPPGFSLVANGSLIKKSERVGLEGITDIEHVGSTEFVFESNKPVKYLSFIVGDLSEIAEDSSVLPLHYFQDSNVRSQQWDYLEEAKSILTLFDSWFGPYPYESFSIVHRLWPQAGGVSPPSFVVLNDMLQISHAYRRFLNNSPVDLSRWKEYFLAHEIAHQWWGHGVTWYSYHDQWLSEGLAQFSSVLYLREKYGEKAFSTMIRKFSSWTKKMTNWGAITMGSRISYFNYEAFQSIVYDKTTLVLFLLKDYLGEDVFFRALKEFFVQKQYSQARTGDFIKVFEKVSGKDLSLFFENWFNSYLLPEISVTHSLEKVGEQYFLNLKIVQPKILFVFPLWVEWKEGGEKKRKKLLIKNSIQDFSFSSSEKMKNIIFNPDEAVPGVFR
ncbi:M1 family aminopeptidase [Acidobacteriota bacterium]